jgi:hypothetical protein
MKHYWCLILGLAVVPLASADESSSTRPLVFSVHDLNRDGYLDRAEFERLASDCWARRARRRGRPCTLAFDLIDADGDGRLSEQELLAVLPWRGGRFRGRAWARDRTDGGPPGSLWGPH